MGKIFLRALSGLTVAVILSLVLSSCSQPGHDRSSTREWSVRLQDSSGTLRFSLPLSFDTMHSWIAADDGQGEGQYYYRIQSSKTKVEQSGFLQYSSDTMYRMTLMHAIEKTQFSKSFDPHKLLATALQRNPSTGIQLELGKNIDTATILAYGAEYACISTMDTLFKEQSKGRINTTVSVFNAHKGNLLLMVFESTLNNYKDTAFTRQCLDAVRTIRLEKKQ